jgi:hypothetical protein
VSNLITSLKTAVENDGSLDKEILPSMISLMRLDSHCIVRNKLVTQIAVYTPRSTRITYLSRAYA